MNKLIASASAVGVTASLLFAPLSSVVHASTPVTITFYESMGSKLGKELQNLTNQFEKQNPSIQVQLVFTASYSTLQQKLTASVAARNEPTIAQLEDSWEQKFVDDGIIAPLNQVLPQKSIHDLMPVWIRDNTFNGKLYSIPFNKSDYVLYYNTDDFKKAGIKTPPTTWAQLESDAIKLTKSGVSGFGMQPNYYTFEMFLRQAGGTDLKDNNRQAAFANQAGMRALSFMTKLAHQDKAASVISANAYLSDGFNANEYAMDIDTVAALTYINNPNTHFALAPIPRGVKAAVPTAGTNVALFANATPQQKAAAVKYLEFLIAPKTTMAWSTATGYLPVDKSIVNSNLWKAYTKKHPLVGIGPSELQNAFYGPRVANMFSGETEASTQIANAVNGTVTVSQGLTQAAQAINQALASN